MSVSILSKCIKKSKMTLKEHQIRVVNHMRLHRGLIVSHAVGSGKTLTAVTVAQCFLDDNPNGKIIVVTPVSLQGNFKKEMISYGISPEDHHYEFHTLQGFASTYDSLLNDKIDKKMNETICDQNTLLIIDEAHNLRTNLEKYYATVLKKLYKLVFVELMWLLDVHLPLVKYYY